MQYTHLLRLCGFTLLLLAARMCLCQNTAYLFLVWNLFLAWIPLFILKLYTGLSNQPRKYLLLIFALLFLPNAPYLITDLFHLAKQKSSPLWLDTLLLSSFALLGGLLFMAACSQFFEAIKQSPFSKHLPLIKPCVMLLNGYGIYLGRYLRFNSWDVITQPLSLAKSIAMSVVSYDNLKLSVPVTLCFGLFLFLIYEVFTAKNKRIEFYH